MLGLRNIVLLGRTNVFFVAWFGLIYLCILWHMALSFYFIFRTLSLGSSLGHFFKDVLVDIPCVGCTTGHDRCLFPTFMFLHSNFSVKKDKKMKKKSPPHRNKIFLPFFNATFQCGRYDIFKFFLPLKTWKKNPLKVAHNRPQFFFHVLAGCPNQPRIDFSCYKYVQRRICSLIYGSRTTDTRRLNQNV